MTVGSLLNDLAASGVGLDYREGRLAVLGAERLSDALRGRVLEHRDALIRLLQARERSGPLPRLTDDPDRRAEPFPLTDLQQAYWLGRQSFMPLGGVAAHHYGEYEVGDLDIVRLEAAFNGLIARHEMLRAIVEPDGRQRILSDVPPYRFAVTSYAEAHACEAGLAAARARMSHQVFDTARWPLFEVAITRGPQACVLHLSIDLLIADFLSLVGLSQEWRERYDDPATPVAPPRMSMRDYALALDAPEMEARRAKARAYWAGRLANLPPAPALPTGRGLLRTFRRREAMLEPEAWSRFKRQAAALGVSPTSAIIAAFSEVLARWSGNDAFSLAVTHFNRLPLHPAVRETVGDFTSVSLTEVRRDPDAGFAARAAAVQAQLRRDMEHADYSGVRVARDLQAAAGRVALFPVVFTSALPLFGAGEDIAGFEALGPAIYEISQTPQVVLDHVVAETAGALRLRWDTREGAIAEQAADDMFASYTSLVRRLATDTGLWAQPLLAEIDPEDLAVRAAANATDVRRAPRRLDAMFLQSAARTPDAVAVVEDDREITYAELSARAAAIAAELLRRGLKPAALVAIDAASGADRIAAVLAVLMAQGAYVPLSPAWPDARKVEVATEAGVCLTICDGPRDLWDPATLLRLDEPLPPAAPPYPAGDTEALAYVIFTSGSSGRPKGVAVSHRAASNTIEDINARFGVGPQDRVLALSDLAFDLSVYDIFGLFAVGGAVVTVDERRNGNRNPGLWMSLIDRHAVSVWNSVPALMEMLAAHMREAAGALSPLRLIMLSGDWVPVALPDILAGMAPRAVRVSLGGATEAAIWSICHTMGGSYRDCPSVPYGRPLANQRWHVLDAAMRPTPRLVPGELYIAGEGLAREYWGRPDLTDAAFVRGPDGDRLYRTGDMGRYLPDGEIEFLGRRDGQVKIGGFRVELEEIEARLRGLDGVAGAVAVVLRDRPGAAELVAAVVVEADATFSPAQVLATLRQQLPHYMVPRRIQPVDVLPLSANGKVDRLEAARRLAARASRAVESEASAGDLESTILTILSGMSGGAALAEVNFFEQGFSSLELVKLHAALQDHLGMEVDQVAAFDHPTPRALALHLSGGVAGMTDMVGPAVTVRVVARRERLARRRGAILGGSPADGAADRG